MRLDKRRQSSEEGRGWWAGSGVVGGEWWVVGVVGVAGREQAQSVK